MNELESIHIVPCIVHGLSCCQHRLVATGREDKESVTRHPVWCSKWRQNRIKDKVFHACEKEYRIPEGGKRE